MPMMSAISHDVSSPKASLKSASDEVDLQLENDRHNADLDRQIGIGPSSGKNSYWFFWVHLRFKCFYLMTYRRNY